MADSRDRVFEDLAGEQQRNRDNREQQDFRRSTEDYLKSIDERLKNLGGASQSDARNAGTFFRRQANSVPDDSMYRHRNSRRGFTDNFEGAIFDAMGGQEFLDKLDGSLSKLADSLGVSIEDLSGSIGQRLGTQVAEVFKNTSFGRNFQAKLDKLSSSIFDDGIGSIADMIRNQSQSSEFGDILSDVDDMDDFWDAMRMSNASMSTLTDGAETLGLNFRSLGPIIGNIAKSAAAFAPEILAAVGIFILLNEVLQPIVDVLESALGWLVALFKSANRYEDMRKKRQDNMQKRFEADVKTMIEYPMKILEESVNNIIDTWNSNLQIINATQGYDKAGLQDLMSNFAQRLRSEGLTSVVSGTDIVTNLSNVLKTGLSGKVAEEFAYQATLLNEAIPTQDFFSYAEAYAAVAANAIASGKSQAQAISAANENLKSFANSLLYSNRVLSEGFTTGLSNASDIFTKAVQIATAGGSTNYSGIGNVLVGIAGQVGAVAPDLVNTMIDTIYKAATGGNSPEITALRSLAGTGASNTAFLRAFVQNPQQVFVNMFNKLAEIYNSSNDAYMERAEALAQTFGVSFDAFSRIDFIRLADSVSRMTADSAQLDMSMQLLQDGQTKTTEEQLKAAEINKIMIEEGLSYVLDNAASQAIQQHLWDEQLANELMEAEYVVELGSSTMKFMDDWRSLTNRIKNFFSAASTATYGMSPSGLITTGSGSGSYADGQAYYGYLEGIIGTALEQSQITSDINQMLELGKVGSGNATEKYQLTTYGLSYGSLTDSLVNMMGGNAAYRSGISNHVNQLSNDINALHNISSLYYGNNPNSISKATSVAVSNILSAASETDKTHSLLNTAVSTISKSTELAAGRIKEMLSYDYMFGEYITQGKSYQEWASSASRFGISDLSASLKAAGYDESSLKTLYEDQLSYVNQLNQATILQDEQNYRDRARAFWDEYFPNTFEVNVTDLITTTNNTLDSIYQWNQAFEGRFFEEYSDPLQTMLQLKLDEITTNQIDWKDFFTEQWIETLWGNEFVGTEGKFTKFFDEFMNYFINHTYYDTYYNADDVQRIKSLEADEQQSANSALADVLTQNINDLTDPTMQTNALLAQILLIVSAIQQHNNTVGVFSLPDSLSALSLGLSNTTADEVASMNT